MLSFLFFSNHIQFRDACLHKHLDHIVGSQTFHLPFLFLLTFLIVPCQLFCEHWCHQITEHPCHCFYKLVWPVMVSSHYPVMTNTVISINIFLVYGYPNWFSCVTIAILILAFHFYFPNFSNAFRLSLNIWLKAFCDFLSSQQASRSWPLAQVFLCL